MSGTAQPSDIEISMVVAIARNGVIGSQGAMPWRLSTDLKRFKAITMGKPVVMGRKTYQSVGKALPGRRNLVITRNKGFAPPDADVFLSLGEALASARETAVAEGQSEVCIVGGGEIYRQALPLADILHVTYVDSEPEGDTVFPDIDAGTWRIETEQSFPAGERDSAATRYVVYRRKAR